MKALISVLLGAWLFAIGTGLQAQTRVITTSDPIFTRAELDQMLAPIALYPDTVLSHILIAATYPLEVEEADRWIRRNRYLEGEDAVNAASEEGWDPSVAALTAFPDILRRMSDEPEWTQNLGDAFLADEGRVMDAIQNLRSKAYASGHLRKMKHVKVQREKKIIIIEPAVERVVYIPYYDTRVVYGNWWWDRNPPVYWHSPTTYVHVGGFYWGPRIYLGSTFFFSSVHWPQRRIVVIDYHHHHHHHPRYYSARKIAHYHGARHWEHNPRHRHNVVYRGEHVRHRYAAAQNEGRRFSRDWRDERNHRDGRHSSAPRLDQRHDGRRDQHERTQLQRDAGKRESIAERRERLGEQRDRSNLQDRRERSMDQRGDQRREHLQARDRAQPSQQDRAARAEQVRERLAANRGGESPRAVNRDGGEKAPQWRNREERQGIPRTPGAQTQGERGERAVEVRQREERREREAGLERRERTQPQQPQREVRAERREQAQERHAPSREWSNRRDVESSPRVERAHSQRQDIQRPAMERQPMERHREMPQRTHEQRSFERPAREHSAPRGAEARPERERRFER